MQGVGCERDSSAPPAHLVAWDVAVPVVGAVIRIPGWADLERPRVVRVAVIELVPKQLRGNVQRHGCGQAGGERGAGGRARESRAQS